jgi:hypothetical protein
MDNFNIALRVGEIRREIAAIRDANRIYQACSAHHRLQNDLHETRRLRLQEIKAELDALFRRAK